MKTFMIIILSVLSIKVAYSKGPKCPGYHLCEKMETLVGKYRKNLNSKKDFNEVLKVAKQLTSKNCKVEGIKREIPTWVSCYNQGYQMKNGKVTGAAYARYNQMEVLEWFLTIKNSKFPGAQEFISSKEFRSGLDGAHYCMFVKSEGC